MRVAEEHRHDFATEIGQPALLAVKVGKLEVFAELGTGDVSGAKGRSLRSLIASSQREQKRKAPDSTDQFANGQTRIRQ